MNFFYRNGNFIAVAPAAWYLPPHDKTEKATTKENDILFYDNKKSTDYTQRNESVRLITTHDNV